jgi:hypothetical protein
MVFSFVSPGTVSGAVQAASKTGTRYDENTAWAHQQHDEIETAA